MFTDYSLHYPNIYPPESSPRPPPSYSIYNPIAQSESDDSDVFPPESFNDTDSDWD